MTEARYRELLTEAPPITRKEWDALRRFVPRRSVMSVAFVRTVNRQFDSGFSGDRLTIRMPQPYRRVARLP